MGFVLFHIMNSGCWEHLHISWIHKVYFYLNAALTNIIYL